MTSRKYFQPGLPHILSRQAEPHPGIRGHHAAGLPAAQEGSAGSFLGDLNCNVQFCTSLDISSSVRPLVSLTKALTKKKAMIPKAA